MHVGGHAQAHALALALALAHANTLRNERSFGIQKSIQTSIP